MDRKLRLEKLKMWKENLKQLEEQLRVILAKKGQGASDSNLSENLAYNLAVEEETTCRVRIEEVKKIIADLEVPSFAHASQSLVRRAGKASAGKGK